MGFACTTIIALLVAALGPVSDIDSLDYHLGVPLQWLRDGSAKPLSEWFHARLTGTGEGLNLLGLALGSDSIGALFQASSVLAAIAAVGAGQRKLQDRLLATLLVTASPVLISLALTQKPTLLPAAGTTLAMVMLAERGASIDRASLGLALACAAGAAGARSSFLLSAAVVIGVALSVAARVRLLRYGITVAAIAIAVLALPVYARNVVFYGDPVSPMLEKWLSADPALMQFARYVRNFSGQHTLLHFLRLPIEITVTRHPAALTTVLGIGTLAIFFAGGDGRSRLLIRSAALLAVLIAFLAPLSSRFFLEPYLWCAAAASSSPSRHTRFFFRALTGQAGLTTALAVFAAVTLSPGIISTGERERVMSATTDGWALAQWINVSVPADAVIAVESRAYALMPRRFVPIDLFRFYAADEVRSLPRFLASHGVTVIVVTGNIEEGFFAPVAGSLGRVIAGPVTFTSTARNPRNRAQQTWRAIEWRAPS